MCFELKFHINFKMYSCLSQVIQGTVTLDRACPCADPKLDDLDHCTKCEIPGAAKIFMDRKRERLKTGMLRMSSAQQLVAHIF